MGEYDLPSIISLGSKYELRNSSLSNSPKTGSVLKVVPGACFGTSDRTATNIRTGGTSSENSIWTSDTIIGAFLSGGAAQNTFCLSKWPRSNSDKAASSRQWVRP